MSYIKGCINKKLSITIEATLKGIVSVPNPGASRMRLWIDSTGTTTGSTIGIWVNRGYNQSGNLIT